MKFFDLRVPFFLPLWRRILTVASSGGWAVFELANGNPGWAAIFGAASAFCAYEFFIVFDPENFKGDKEN